MYTNISTILTGGEIYGILASNLTEEYMDDVTQGWVSLGLSYNGNCSVDYYDRGPARVKSDFYEYQISDYLHYDTRDGTSMADILCETRGACLLEEECDIPSTSDYWIGLRCITSSGMVSAWAIFDGWSDPGWHSFYLRPVVTLNANVVLTDENLDGIFEIN